MVDADLPPEMELSAWNEEGTVMAMRHTRLPVEGVQFHPESVLTEVGAELLRNFLYPQETPGVPRRRRLRPRAARTGSPWRPTRS